MNNIAECPGILCCLSDTLVPLDCLKKDQNMFLKHVEYFSKEVLMFTPGRNT